MSEIIVKMDIVKIDDRHIKIKGGEYFRDLVRCKDCKHWCKGDEVYGICNRCANTRQMRHDDFCSRGEREGKR